MKKYIALILGFLPALMSFAIAGYFAFKPIEVSQFAKKCFDVNEEIACGYSTVTFNGEYAKQINPEFYPKEKAFWILDTVNSYDCYRIIRAANQTIDDQPLKDYFLIKFKICEHEVEIGKRKPEHSIVTGPYNPYEMYQYDFPEGTVFVAPKEYA